MTSFFAVEFDILDEIKEPRGMKQRLVRNIISKNLAIQTWGYMQETWVTTQRYGNVMESWERSKRMANRVLELKGVKCN
jgi:hypothetical protein